MVIKLLGRTNQSPKKDSVSPTRQIQDAEARRNPQALGEPEPPLTPLIFAPARIMIGSFISRQLNSTNPSSFDINSIYTQVVDTHFRKDSHRYSLPNIINFYLQNDANGNPGLGKILLEKESTFRPPHILTEFNYSPLNKRMEILGQNPDNVTLQDARRNSTTSKIWLRNYTSGIFKNWNARWAIIESILETQPSAEAGAANKHAEYSSVFDADAEDDISLGMNVSFPNFDDRADFKNHLESLFIPKVTQTLAAQVLEMALKLNAADTYIKSCYNLNPISDFHSNPGVASQTDTDFFTPGGAAEIRPYFDNSGSDEADFFRSVNTPHRRNNSENTLSFGGKYYPGVFKIQKYIGGSLVTKSWSLNTDQHPSDLESNRSQIQLLRNINLYVDELQFRDTPPGILTEKIKYIPGPRYDIFNFSEPSEDSIYHTGILNDRPSRHSNSYLEAFFIRRAFFKSLFLNSRQGFLYTNHNIEDGDDNKDIFPRTSQVDLNNFKTSNTDDISNFFYNPVLVGNKIVVLTDSLTKDYYSKTGGIHFTSIIDELEIKKNMLNRFFLSEEGVNSQELSRRFLPAPDKSKLAEYVFDKMFPIKTSTPVIEQYESKDPTSSDLASCRANILLDHRNIVSHLTRGRMIKFIWKSAIAAAVHSEENKNGTDEFRYDSYTNYSIKFFNVDSSTTGRNIAGVDKHYMRQSMGFENVEDMSRLDLDESTNLNFELESANASYDDRSLPGMRANSPRTDGHVFGHQVRGDVFHGITGDGKIKEDFIYAINNSLCHAFPNIHATKSLIFLFVLVQLSIRAENPDIEENPIFLKGGTPIPNVAYELAEHYLRRQRPGTNPWKTQNYARDDISEQVREFIAQILDKNREERIFSPEAEEYFEFLNKIRELVISLPDSPFSRNEVFQDIYDEHDQIKDYPNQINERIRKYRAYLHGIGGLAGNFGSRMSINETDLDRVGEFLDINTGTRSYKNVVLDFLGRGNFNDQFINPLQAGNLSRDAVRRLRFGQSRQLITADMGDYRRASAASTDLGQSRGRNISGVRGLGAGGTRSQATFANIDQSALRTSSFKENILEPLKDRVFKFGKHNPIVLLAENICAQLFYGFKALSPSESADHIGYYHTFQENSQGLLPDLGLMVKNNERMELGMTKEELFSVVWSYVKIAASLQSNLPNFNMKFTFDHTPSNSTERANSSRSYEEKLRSSFETLPTFGSRTGVEYGDNLRGLKRNLSGAEGMLEAEINSAIGRGAVSSNAIGNIVDGLDENERSNFNRANNYLGLVDKLYNYVELANAYFFVAESLTSIEPEFKLEISTVSDSSLDRYYGSTGAPISTSPIKHFKNALKIGCLPHVSIINPNNKYNFKKLIDVHAPAGNENANKRSTKTALEIHLKSFGAFKNVRNNKGQPGAESLGINAIDYGYRGYPSHSHYIDVALKTRRHNSGLHSIYSFIDPSTTNLQTGDVVGARMAYATGLLATPPSICGFLPTKNRQENYGTNGRENRSTILNEHERSIAEAIANNPDRGEIPEDHRIANFGFANIEAAKNQLDSIGFEKINYGTRNLGQEYSVSDERRDAVREELTNEFLRLSGQPDLHLSYGPPWVYSELSNKITTIARKLQRSALGGHAGPTDNYEVVNVVPKVRSQRKYVNFITQVNKVKYDFVEAITTLSRNDIGFGRRIGLTNSNQLTSRTDWFHVSNRINQSHDPLFYLDNDVVSREGDKVMASNARELGLDPVSRIIEMCKFAIVMLAQNPAAANGDNHHGMSDVYRYIYNDWSRPSPNGTVDSHANFETYIFRFLYSLFQMIQDEKNLSNLSIPVYLPNYKRFKYGPSGIRKTNFLANYYKDYQNGDVRRIGTPTPGGISSTPTARFNASSVNRLPGGQKWPLYGKKFNILYKIRQEGAGYPGFESLCMNSKVFPEEFEKRPFSHPFDKYILVPNEDSPHRCMSRNSTVNDVYIALGALFRETTAINGAAVQRRLDTLGDFHQTITRSTGVLSDIANNNSSFNITERSVLPGNRGNINADTLQGSTVTLVPRPGNNDHNRQKLVIPRSRKERWGDYYVPLSMLRDKAPWINGVKGTDSSLTPHTGDQRDFRGVPLVQGDQYIRYGCPVAANWILNSETSQTDRFLKYHYNDNMLRANQNFFDGATTNTFNFYSPGNGYHNTVVTKKYIPFTMTRSTFCSFGELKTRELYIDENGNTNQASEIQYFNLDANLNGSTNPYYNLKYSVNLHHDNTGSAPESEAILFRAVNVGIYADNNASSGTPPVTNDFTYKSLANYSLFNNSALPPPTVLDGLNDLNRSLLDVRSISGVFEDENLKRVVPRYMRSDHVDSRAVRARVHVYQDMNRGASNAGLTRFRLLMSPVYAATKFSLSNQTSNGVQLPSDSGRWKGNTLRGNNPQTGGNDFFRQELGYIVNAEADYTATPMLITAVGKNTSNSPIISIFPFKPFVIDYGPTMAQFSPLEPWVYAPPNTLPAGLDGIAEKSHTIHPKLTRFPLSTRIANGFEAGNHFTLRDSELPSMSLTSGNLHIYNLSDKKINERTGPFPHLGALFIHYDTDNCKIIVQWRPTEELLNRMASGYNNGTQTGYEGSVLDTLYLYIPGLDYYMHVGANAHNEIDRDSGQSFNAKFVLKANTFGQDYRVLYHDNFSSEQSTYAEYELVNRRGYQIPAQQAYQKKIYIGNVGSDPATFSLNSMETDATGPFAFNDLLNGAENFSELDVNIPIFKNTRNADFQYDFNEDDDFLYEMVTNLSNVEENPVNFPLATEADLDRRNARINLGNTYRNFFKNYKYFPEFTTSADYPNHFLAPFKTDGSVDRLGTHKSRIIGVYAPHEVLGKRREEFDNAILNKRKHLRSVHARFASSFVDKMHGALQRYVVNTSFFDKTEVQIPNLPTEDGAYVDLFNRLGVFPENYSNVQNEGQKYLRELNFADIASNYFVYLVPLTLSYPEVYVYAKPGYEHTTIPGASLVSFKWESMHKHAFYTNNYADNEALGNAGLFQVDSYKRLEQNYMNYLVSLYKTSKFQDEAYARAMNVYKSAIELASRTPEFDENLHETLEAQKYDSKLRKMIRNIGLFSMTPDVLSNIESTYLLSTIHSLKGEDAFNFNKENVRLTDEQVNIFGVPKPGKFQMVQFEEQQDGITVPLRSDYYRAPFKLSPYGVYTSTTDQITRDSFLQTWKFMEEKYAKEEILSENHRVCVIGIEAGSLEKILNNERVFLEDALLDTDRTNVRYNDFSTAGFEVEIVIKDILRPYLKFESLTEPMYFSRTGEFYLHPPSRAANDNISADEENFKHWQNTPLPIILSNRKEESFLKLLDRIRTLQENRHVDYLKNYTFASIDDNSDSKSRLSDSIPGIISRRTGDELPSRGDELQRASLDFSSFNSLSLYLKLYISRVLGLDYYSFMIPSGEEYPILETGFSDTDLKGFEEANYQELVGPYLRHIIEHIGEKDGDDTSIFNTIKYFIERKDLRKLYDSDQITHFDSVGRKVLKPNSRDQFSIFTNELIKTENNGEDMILRPFEFNSPIVRESLRASETMLNINTFDPDGFRKTSLGFAFDKIIAIPYKLSNFRLSNEIDRRYRSQFAADYPSYDDTIRTGFLSRTQRFQISQSLEYLEIAPGTNNLVLKDDGNHPFTLQVIIRPVKNITSR